MKAQDKLDWLLALFVGIIAALAFSMSGCARRLSNGQAQALAEARAGAQAVVEKEHAITLEQDPAVAALMARALLDDIEHGALGFTLAATADLELPAPTFQPVVLREQPMEAAKYAAAGKLAALNPPKGWGAGVWAALIPGAIGVVGVALTLAKNIPGVGGVAASLASAAWTLLAPKQTKAKEEAIDNSLDVAVLYGEYLATALRRAGLGTLVDAAKDKAQFLASKLGATEEIRRRLVEARSDDAHQELSVASLPQRIQAPVLHDALELKPTTVPTLQV